MDSSLERRLHDLDAPARERVVAAVRQVLASDGRVVAAWLHGSFVRGGPFRDLDVAVLLAPGTARPAVAIEEIEHRIYENMPERGIEPDVKAIGDAALAFRGEAIRTGRRIYVRDVVVAVRFEVESLNLWFDYRPAWDRYHRALVADLRARGAS
ncbi:MAG: nucleotidyltransferase domain-containing protein [Deltaproteobacteria bacterium]|nr:nucleotidyltransferase domain-containing protein [Deltaproteobacteria bacterium]